MEFQMKKKVGILLLVLTIITSNFSIAQAVKPGDTENVMFTTAAGGLASVVITILVTDGLEIVDVSSTQSLFIGNRSESIWQLFSLGIASIMTIVVEVKVKEGVVEDQKVIMKQDYNMQGLFVADSVAEVIIDEVWSEWIVTKEPTCETPGQKKRDSNKGNSETVEIPALKHKWSKWNVITERTETNPGIEERICENDEKHKETRQIKLPGDADDNNKVDVQDLLAIIEFIISGTEPASLYNADENDDNYVNIFDLMSICENLIKSQTSDDMIISYVC